MKNFLIKYRFSSGSANARHQLIAQFIAALDSDPELKGKISYRCMREKGGSGYYHLAAASDKDAISANAKPGLVNTLYRRDQTGRRWPCTGRAT